MASAGEESEAPKGDGPAETDGSTPASVAAPNRRVTTCTVGICFLAVAVGVWLVMPSLLRSAGLSATTARYAAYALGIAILGAGGFVTYLAWRVLGEPQVAQTPRRLLGRHESRR